MAITTDQKYILNNLAGPIASKLQLGTLLDNAEEGYSTLYAGSHTTAGGAAAEAITVTGLLSTDLVFVSIKTVGATPRTIVSAAPTANTLTVTFSGDPAADHVVHYMVLRAAV